jgi:hypothetical protein
MMAKPTKQQADTQLYVNLMADVGERLQGISESFPAESSKRTTLERQREIVLAWARQFPMIKELRQAEV